MADVTPNYSLEIQGLELEKDQLSLNIKSQLYRIAQSRDEITRINTNIDATRAAIVALDTKLKALKG
jgi:predicted  nucleic acid-binding Zn-ribbon protein